MTVRSAHHDARDGFRVRLDVFEGPFQLLLSLISERRVDVCDVPVAKLTEDYLAHVDAMQQMDLEVATEFLVVAATLLQLKARALLPQAPSGAEDVDDDLERDLLVARLLEVRTFQAAGEHLASLLAAGDRRHPPAPAPDDPGLRQVPVLADIRPGDLARTLIEVVLEGLRGVDTSLLVGQEISTQEAGAALLAHLRAHGTSTFDDVVRGRGRAWAVALFCAMLELGMRGELVLGPGARLGDIEIVLAEGESV